MKALGFTLPMWPLVWALASHGAQAQARLEHGERPMATVAIGIGTMMDVDRRTDGIDRDQPAAGLDLIELDGDGPGLGNEGSLAIGLAYLHPLLRHIALGVEVQYLNWATREDYRLGYPRYHALDLAIVPRAQVPWGRRVLLIASLPFGASLNFIDASIERPGLREEVSTGTGFNLALRAGAAIALLSNFGVKAELSLSWHWFHHSWNYVATDGSPFTRGSEQVRYASTALVLLVGGYYALP